MRKISCLVNGIQQNIDGFAAGFSWVYTLRNGKKRFSTQEPCTTPRSLNVISSDVADRGGAIIDGCVPSDL